MRFCNEGLENEPFIKKVTVARVNATVARAVARRVPTVARTVSRQVRSIRSKPHGSAGPLAQLFLSDRRNRGRWPCGSINVVLSSDSWHLMLDLAAERMPDNCQYE